MKSLIAYIKFCLFIALISFSSSCGVTNKQVENYTKVDANNYQEIINLSNSRSQLLENIRANLSVGISFKGRDISSSMQLLCKKGEAMKLTLTPFPFIEAARIWFNKDGVYIWDKINSVYLHEDYDDFSQKLGITINYPIIESLFLGQIFVKDIPKEDKNTITQCNRDMENLGYTLKGVTNSYDYTFLLNKAALVEKMNISSKNDNQNYMIAIIEGFQEPVNGIFIPTKENINVLKKGKGIFSLKLDWKRAKVNLSDEFPNIEVHIPNDITKVRIDDILKQMK